MTNRDLTLVGDILNISTRYTSGRLGERSVIPIERINFQDLVYCLSQDSTKYFRPKTVYDPKRNAFDLTGNDIFYTALVAARVPRIKFDVSFPEGVNIENIIRQHELDSDQKEKNHLINQFIFLNSKLSLTNLQELFSGVKNILVHPATLNRQDLLAYTMLKEDRVNGEVTINEGLIQQRLKKLALEIRSVNGLIPER